jgi:Cu+-exporting ATPase
MEQDPVCGMSVDPKAAAGSAEYGGKTYHFCSAGCQQQFEADPAKFAKA